MFTVYGRNRDFEGLCAGLIAVFNLATQPAIAIVRPIFCRQSISNLIAQTATNDMQFAEAAFLVVE